MKKIIQFPCLSICTQLLVRQNREWSNMSTQAAVTGTGYSAPINFIHSGKGDRFFFQIYPADLQNRRTGPQFKIGLLDQACKDGFIIQCSLNKCNENVDIGHVEDEAKFHIFPDE